MALNAEQQEQVKSWVAEGRTLAEIQKAIEAEFGERMTYMDVRFLVDDLNVELQAEGPQFVEPKQALGAEPEPSGGVRVTVDKVAHPSALASGEVNFSDGVKARWRLDQMGRLGLEGPPPGYQPPADDLPQFQQALQKALDPGGMY